MVGERGFELPTPGSDQRFNLWILGREPFRLSRQRMRSVALTDSVPGHHLCYTPPARLDRDQRAQCRLRLRKLGRLRFPLVLALVPECASPGLLSRFQRLRLAPTQTRVPFRKKSYVGRLKSGNRYGVGLWFVVSGLVLQFHPLSAPSVTTLVLFGVRAL